MRYKINQRKSEKYRKKAISKNLPIKKKITGLINGIRFKKNSKSISIRDYMR